MGSVMTPSDFDPETFLSSANVDQPLSTRSTPVPEGTFRGQVDRLGARQILTKKQETRTILEVYWDVLDDAVRTELEREKVTVRQDVWLDLDENGRLDQGKGKNVDLGRLREAVGMNEQTGNPFDGLKGLMATISVVHEPGERPEDKYAKVRRVSAVA